jgi:hypothetical protein
MLKTSKVLSIIIIWVLFLFGLLRLIIGLVMAFTSGPNLPELPVYLDFAIGVSSLFLSAVVVRIRKLLD